MTRMLLIIFASGLLVATGCFASLLALGRTGVIDLGDLSGQVEDSFDLDPRDKDDGPTEPGEIVTREFPWSGDDDLTVSVAGEVTYTQGPASKVTITGPVNILDRIRVDGDEIGLIKGKGTRDWTKDVRIQVEAPNVNSFRFNGAQKVAIEGYAQDTLKIEANGAVHLKAKGTARSIDLRMNGASNADLGEVVNDEAKVELNGASNASVSPKTAVDIRINGVGNVSLGAKPPSMKKVVHGIGGVSFTTGEKVSVSVGSKDEGKDASPAVPAAPAAPAAP